MSFLKRFSEDFIQEKNEQFGDLDLEYDGVCEKCDEIDEIDDLCEECTADEDLLEMLIEDGLLEQLPEEDVNNLVFEKVKAGIVRVSRRSKLSFLGGMSAMAIARKNDAAEYKQYIKHRKKAMLFRDKIQKKYKSKGNKRAREIARRK